MPKIRDMTWQYTSSTTAKSLSCALPDYVAGDLLVAICSADTGTTQAWSATGWTQYTSQSNTTNIGILYKIAGSSETDPLTISYTIAETSNIRIISIMDVDTVTPFANVGNLSTTAARVAMPTTTATRNNSLVLYAVAHSAAAIPTIIEGPVSLVGGSDGTAHSDGLSWGFMATAGTTPNNVYLTSMSAAAQKALTIVVNPPSGGATVIPPYCASDLSLYLDPLSGNVAYNGNTAFAATATTYFGTSLGGRTLSNGTVAAATDVGINSFHSMAQLTGVTTSGTYAGASSVFATANKPNVSGKNVLVHIKPQTPKVLQTTDMLTKSTSKGILFGMCSTAATAFKVWHVHGGGTSWNSAQHIPVVINSTNTSGLIQSTGTLNATSVLAMGYMCSGFTVAPVWQFGSMWALDTTTIAGGNSTTPVNINGIWKVCSEGKERMSVLQQGASQAMIMQPIQFGNGGTNPLNINLDATAIEFPQQYNEASRNIFYCSADNIAGLTYYAGAGDVIKHTNAVISSKSKFHWRIHSNSSASASYDFSGLSIIGAGDVQLYPVTTFNDMSFTNCPSFIQNNAVLTNCTFKETTITSTNPSNISGCDFTMTNSSNAIIITTPGTYTLTNNTFTGYQPNGQMYAAIVNQSGGLVTLNISGGTIPTYYNKSGTTVIVSSASVELTGLKTGSEVRAYLGTDPSTATEIGGIESSGTTFSFSQSYAGQSGYIQVFALGYLPVWLNITYESNNVSIPIQQSIDRVYNNPV